MPLEQREHALVVPRRVPELDGDPHPTRQLRQEVLQSLNEANARLREEIEELRNTNVSLSTRVEELEKPRGLHALLLRLMFWRKR